jgi:hypothetical protein
MTPKQINAAIAKSLGLKYVKSKNPNGDLYYISQLPNYHGSLDAIVPVIRAMYRFDQDKVLTQLHKIIRWQELAITATPAQWCEAYLRAKSLWK